MNLHGTEHPKKSLMKRLLTGVSIATVLGLGWAIFESYHHDLFVLENLAAVVNWPAARVKAEKEQTEQTGQLTEEIHKLHEDVRRLAEKHAQTELALQALAAKINRLLRPPTVTTPVLNNR